MRLPKPGVSVDELKCKICGVKAKEQPNDIKQCTKKHCPYKDDAHDRMTDNNG